MKRTSGRLITSRSLFCCPTKLPFVAGFIVYCLSQINDKLKFVGLFVPYRDLRYIVQGEPKVCPTHPKSCGRPKSCLVLQPTTLLERVPYAGQIF